MATESKTAGEIRTRVTRFSKRISFELDKPKRSSSVFQTLKTRCTTVWKCMPNGSDMNAFTRLMGMWGGEMVGISKGVNRSDASK